MITITEYLSCQHYVFLQQLAFLEELMTADGSNNVAGLKEVAFAIVDAVERHGGLEEEYLFPKLEPHLGEKMGPVAATEFEHREIRKIVKVLKETEDKRAVRIETAKLVALLRDHIAKEEKVLFPMAEDFIDHHVLIEAGKKAQAQERMRTALIK